MEKFKRYAVYFAPRPGPFANLANAWLGWDPSLGQPIAQPAPKGLPWGMAELTAEPAKYGFHGTIRAPFRPGDGVGQDQIRATVAKIASTHAPAVCDGLRVENLHGFLALTPTGNLRDLRALAEGVVRGTNALRAPLTPAEIAKRRPESLSPRQRDLLGEWGYPFVMEEFYFHLTLTGRLEKAEADVVQPIVAAHFAPHLPHPFVVQDLCLYGEDDAGRFHLLHRYPLSA